MGTAIVAPFLGLSGFALACGLLSGAAAIQPARKLPSEDVTYHVVVDSEPRHRVPGGVELSLRLLMDGDGGSDGAGSRVLCKAVYLPWRNLAGVHAGARFLMRAKFRALDGASSPFSYEARLRRHGYDATCKIVHAAMTDGEKGRLSRLREAIARDAANKAGESEATGLFLAMSIGTKDRLTERTERAFEKTGLAHLLVVSGYQVTLVFQMLARICRSLAPTRIGPPIVSRGFLLADIAAATAACTFVMITGVDSSSVRAAIATIVVVCSRLSERRTTMFGSMLFSLIVLSVIWPGSIYEPGTQLTYAALLGIALGVRAGGSSAISVFLRVNFLAYAFTSVVVIFWFGYFAPVGIILNPLVAPVASLVACNLGLAGIVASLVGLDGDGIVLKFCVWFCGYLRDALIEVADGIPDIKVGTALHKIIMSSILVAAAIPLSGAARGVAIGMKGGRGSMSLTFLPSSNRSLRSGMGNKAQGTKGGRSSCSAASSVRGDVHSPNGAPIL